MQESQSRLQVLEDTHNDLQATVSATQEDLDYLRSETGLEAEIRAKFGYAKEGERAIMIMDPDIVEEIKVEEKTFWEKIKGWFGR